nr:hypothetical protein [Tanacetum cinerariifolium]
KREAAYPKHDCAETGQEDADRLTDNQPKQDAEAVGRQDFLGPAGADDDTRVGQGEYGQDEEGDRRMQRIFQAVRGRCGVILFGR